jgi:uncharacterized membrane protein YeiH
MEPESERRNSDHEGKMWALPPTVTALHVLSLVALTAQAMTAALAAGRRSMDWVGVCMLGWRHRAGRRHDPRCRARALSAAVGRKPVLSGAHGGCGVCHGSDRPHRASPQSCVLVLDAIGLVVFTMAGCDVAWQMNQSLPIVIVSGMITGCAGGVLRDILCNDVPLLFRSELYASVSVVTGLFYATAFGLKLNDEVWTALTFVLGLSFRLLAIRYKWEMPKFVFNEDRR